MPNVALHVLPTRRLLGPEVPAPPLLFKRRIDDVVGNEAGLHHAAAKQDQRRSKGPQLAPLPSLHPECGSPEVVEYHCTGTPLPYSKEGKWFSPPDLNGVMSFVL